MNDPNPVAIVAIASAALAIIPAFVLEEGRRRKGIGTLPFTWGYFQGASAMIFGGITAVIGIATADNSYQALFGAFVGSVFALPGWFVVRRRRWAWVMVSILNANPISWIINYNYGRNRWNELRSLKAGPPPQTSTPFGEAPVRHKQSRSPKFFLVLAMSVCIAFAAYFGVRRMRVWRIAQFEVVYVSTVPGTNPFDDLALTPEQRRQGYSPSVITFRACNHSATTVIAFAFHASGFFLGHSTPHPLPLFHDDEIDSHNTPFKSDLILAPDACADVKDVGLFMPFDSISTVIDSVTFAAN